jgi:hypothetical protein
MQAWYLSGGWPAVSYSHLATAFFMKLFCKELALSGLEAAQPHSASRARVESVFTYIPFNSIADGRVVEALACPQDRHGN